MVALRSCATISLISFSTGAFPGILNFQPPVCETVVLWNVLLWAQSPVWCVSVYMRGVGGLDCVIVLLRAIF